MFGTILTLAVITAAVAAYKAKAREIVMQSPPMRVLMATGMVRKERAQLMDPAQTFEATGQSANLTGSQVDLEDADAATVLISTGTIQDGTHTPNVQHAEDDGTGSPDTWEDVAAEDLVDSFDDLSSDEVQWVGYIGTRRFLRCNVDVSGATNGGDYDGVVVRDLMRKSPTQ